LPPLVPGAGQRLGEIFELHAFRLTAVEDRLDDVGSEQCQPQQPVDEAAGDALCLASSAGRLPLAFLRDCGLPDKLIDYPAVAARGGNPVLLPASSATR
jgi:hypothetical protein